MYKTDTRIYITSKLNTYRKKCFSFFCFPPKIHLPSAERFPVQASLTQKLILKSPADSSSPENPSATRGAARIRNPLENQFCGGETRSCLKCTGRVLEPAATAKHGRTRSVTFLFTTALCEQVDYYQGDPGTYCTVSSSACVHIVIFLFQNC